MIIPVYPDRGLTFVRGDGVYLTEAGGGRYLDLTSGYGVAISGYGHPRLRECLEQQLHRLPTLHGSFANDTRSKAAQALLSRCGGGLARLLFCNSGAEANEAALKFAALATGRKRFIACRGSYHGKTLGALSATDGARYRRAFEPLLWDFQFVPYGDAGALAATVDRETAAFIVEPVQGESGIHFPPAGFLRQAAHICRSRGVLLIVDEIQTGTGRTGKFLASQAEGLSPDILTLGKGLAGGLPIGVTLVSAEVAKAIPRGVHTSTMGGNPLAAAGVLAILEFLDEARLTHVAELGSYFLESLNVLAGPLIKDIRGRGLMIGLEVTCSRDAVLKALQKERVLAIPAGETVVRFLPPYVLERTHVDILREKLEGIFASLLLRMNGPCAVS